MKTRNDNVVCEYCGKNLNGENFEETHTRDGHNFCNYECADQSFCDSEDDFLSAKTGE